MAHPIYSPYYPTSQTEQVKTKNGKHRLFLMFYS